MLLHLLNKAPPAAAFQQCMSKQLEGDAIVLFEEGVYALLDERLFAASAALYVLRKDALNRGIAIDDMLARPVANKAPVTAIDYAQWVELSVQYPRSISWY